MSAEFISLKSINIFSTIHQYYNLLGLFFILWLVWSLVKSRFTSRAVEPTEAEVVEKLSAWNPEPLVPQPDKNHPSLKLRQVTSAVGRRIQVNGNDCLNLATHNYLGLLGSKKIEDRAVAAINKYGVGSCGPRGFYGTVDVHLDLEEKLKDFMETEEAIIYSYGFSTVASAIQAYCKRRDIVFVDEKVNFAIQKGLEASRSTVKYFKHNNANDLKRLLMEQAILDRRDVKKAAKIRRFLIVEGIYMNTGFVCPLTDLIPLCKTFKLRIFIDESISFGSLGKNGRGVTEYFGVARHDVDMIMGSLESAVGSIGGFCVGSSFVIEHQRLSGLGYCFSASLPPLLTVAAMSAIEMMQEDPGLFVKLRENCVNIHEKLERLREFELSGMSESPVKHLFIKRLEGWTVQEEDQFIRKICDRCIESNLAVVSPLYLQAEREIPRPSLRICVSACLDKSDIDFAVETLEKCTKEILSL